MITIGRTHHRLIQRYRPPSYDIPFITILRTSHTDNRQPVGQKLARQRRTFEVGFQRLSEGVYDGVWWEFIEVAGFVQFALTLAGSRRHIRLVAAFRQRHQLREVLKIKTSSYLRRLSRFTHVVMVIGTYRVATIPHDWHTTLCSRSSKVNDFNVI